MVKLFFDPGKSVTVLICYSALFFSTSWFCLIDTAYVFICRQLKAGLQISMTENVDIRASGKLTPEYIEIVK